MISMISAELKLTLCVSVASQSQVSYVPIVLFNIESQLIRFSCAYSFFETAHVQLLATVANYVISPLLRALDDNLRFPSPRPYCLCDFTCTLGLAFPPAFSKSLNGESNMNQFCHSRHLTWLQSFPFLPSCLLRHEPRCSTPTYPDKFHLPTIE